MLLSLEDFQKSIPKKPKIITKPNLTVVLAIVAGGGKIKTKRKVVLMLHLLLQLLLNIPSGIIVGAENSNEENNSENAPITITIPVTQQLSVSTSTPQNAPISFRNENHGRGTGRYFGKVDVVGTAVDPGGAISNNSVSLMLIVWMLPL